MQVDCCYEYLNVVEEISPSQVASITRMHLQTMLQTHIQWSMRAQWELLYEPAVVTIEQFRDILLLILSRAGLANAQECIKTSRQITRRDVAEPRAPIEANLDIFEADDY
jgi:hypothetical protein